MLMTPPALRATSPRMSVGRHARELKLLEFIDEARDDAQSLVPEGGIRGVKAERRQKLLVALHAARLQHVEILRLEILLAGLIRGIERVHQAVAEGVGVDVERRMDEVADIRPVVPVLLVEGEGRPQALL